MRKVLIFALSVLMALGGLVGAHAAVTASQDDLLIYPTVELGDGSVLEGLTASITFSCGEHLRWYTDHTFGGETETEFVYSREPISVPTSYQPGSMDVWFTGGLSSSVSGGEISPNASDYGALLQAVAKETPAGGSRTGSLRMADYVRYYLPDYELRYEDAHKECDESASLYGFIGGDTWYQNPTSYRDLMEAFRFPVQPGHIMSVTVDKDDAGRVVGVELSAKSGPELHFLSDVNADGVWFVPVFRDENGAPLPYESPEGHGIYFIPWKHYGNIRYTTGDKEIVMLDVEKAARIFPLEESLRIDHVDIDAGSGTAQMLTLEDGHYILTTCDLERGTVRSRLALLPHAPADPDGTAAFRQEGEYLLIHAQGNIALTDAAGETLYLTAPDTMDQTFGGRFFAPGTGDLRFDGEQLTLIGTTWYQDGTFWTAAWRQGELAYYGEYDCSIMGGNDNWYYSHVTAAEYPITLK